MPVAGVFGPTVTLDAVPTGICTVTMPGCEAPEGAGASAVAATAGAACAAGDASDLRSSTQASASTFTPNNTASATAHMGNLRRGAATLTSNNAGDAWR